MRRSPSGRRTAAVAAALVMLGTFGGSGLTAPAGAAPKTDCTDYGSLPKAPKGSIPRDDRIIVKKDPLASWRAGNRDRRSRRPGGRGDDGDPCRLPRHPQGHHAWPRAT